jgi:Fe/S biogenesis protein NfuA
MFLALEKLFDEQIRPALASHGGSIEIVDIDNEKLFLKFSGGCQGCSSSQATLTQGIEQIVKENFSDIKEIVDLTDHAQGANPFM